MIARTSAPKSDQIDVTIRIDTAHAAAMDKIVQALAAAGLSQITRHDRFMMVNGTVAATRMDALRAITGIASVRQDQTYTTL